MFSSFFSKSAQPLMVAVNVAVQAGIQVALKKNSPKAVKAVKAGMQPNPSFFGGGAPCQTHEVAPNASQNPSQTATPPLLRY